MKKFLFLFLFSWLTTNSFSQDIYLGKSMSDIKSSTNYQTSIINQNDVIALYLLVDSNITDVYLFRKDVCYEYSRIYANIGIKIVESTLISFLQKGDLWIDTSKGLVAKIYPISTTIYKVSYRKENNTY